jgi:hypothetical protein
MNNGRRNNWKKNKSTKPHWKNKLVQVPLAFRTGRKAVAAAQALKNYLKLMTTPIGKKGGKMIAMTLIWRDKERESEL